MAIDPSIPLQVKPVDPMGALSSVLNVQNQRAQLQGQQQQNQQSAIALQERQGVQGVMGNIKQYQDSQGNIDFNKLMPDIMAVAPTTGAAVINGVYTAQNAATQARTAVTSLDSTTRGIVGNAMYSLKGQPPEVVNKTLAGLSASYPTLAPAVDFMGKYIIGPSAGDPAALDAHLDTAGKFIQTAPTQQLMNTPEGVTVNDQASTRVVSQKPGTTVAPGDDLPGTYATLKPGPMTPTIGSDGTQGVIGAPQAHFEGLKDPGRNVALAAIASGNEDPRNRQEAANVLANRPQGFIPSSLPAGQVQNIGNNVDEMNRHFSGLQDSSSGAALQQGLIGNIKSLAAGAATGTGAGRKAFVSGLLAAMHVPGTGDEAKDTDLLEKNMAQLNLSSPATTDAMRTIVNAARPHGTMQEGAITEAADQLSGQIQANMAIRNMLAPAKFMGDPATYQAQRQKLEGIADPRAWQYVSLGPGSPAAKEFMGKLQPTDRATLIQKVDQLEQMGMLK